jgi:hypothetical protein
LTQQEKVKNEETIQQKLMVQYVSEYAVDLKRKEMEEKHAEDMLESYLKAKNMRVRLKSICFIHQEKNVEVMVQEFTSYIVKLY